MQEIKLKAAALWGRLDKTQLLRHGVQLISFLLFPGLFLTVFHAIRDVVMALVNGTFAFASASGSLATLVVTLGVTALWGRFFCGYLCTFGALQELLALAGRKLLPELKKVPATVDRILKYMKYGVLFALVLFVWTLQLPVDSTLNPWGVFGALLSGNLSIMADAVPTWGFGLLLLILILSLFVERAFCRYLCPLGVLFTPLSAGRLFRVRRLETACTGCQACTRSCAMGVAVHEDSFIRSGECIDCMRCLGACQPQALKTLPAPAVAGTASALALCGLIQVGRIAVPETVEQTASTAAAPVGDYSGRQVVSAESAPSAAQYADGVYTGQGNGFRGVISAQVTVEGGRITDVTILSSRDDGDFFQRAQTGVIPAILQAQSVGVSAVSGATYSSRGILEAVADALQLDASALPEITDTHGRGKGSGARGQKGADRTAPSAGESGGSGRKGRGQRQSGSNQQSGSDSDQSGRQRKAKQSDDTSNG